MATPPFAGPTLLRRLGLAPAARIVEALLEQGFADGSESGFDIPFTYRRLVPTGDGSEAFLLVTGTPVGAVQSLVFPVVWSNDTTTSSEDLLQAEVTAITARKPATEEVSGMYGVDENDLEDGAEGPGL
jgi:hypothetical protein